MGRTGVAQTENADRHWQRPTRPHRRQLEDRRAPANAIRARSATAGRGVTDAGLLVARDAQGQLSGLEPSPALAAERAATLAAQQAVAAALAEVPAALLTIASAVAGGVVLQQEQLNALAAVASAVAAV